ncbi:glucose-induced degradation protein 8 homolog [Mya arenaria]|uniref:glucose-induced degradation protein 8 homolog n=1 Tax=Mya arenaria TaxID=6604 RepID=UPI0022E7A2B2|nr:glucose-induced degradation protein 8 homolog [Mya arenaria]
MNTVMERSLLGAGVGVEKEEWMDLLNSHHITRAEMNKLIMNYLVTEGFKESAEKFRMESGIQPPVDLNELDDRIRIREEVQNGRIESAIALVNNLHPELLDNDRYLYFHLQQQHLIELIRARNVEAALEYAQTHLAERGEENPDILSELERTLALLAFEEPEKSPFGDLLHLCQRQKVASELNAAILETDATPKLANLLKLLLWSQEELDKKKIRYPKMTDVSSGMIESPK